MDQLVTDAAGVEQIAARARAAGRCAIDTEFFWERTYAPVLCLVQIAVDGEVVLIDPLAGAPLEPIAELIADPAVEILMHAPAADVLAFGLHYGTRAHPHPRHAGGGGLRRADGVGEPRAAARRRIEGLARPPRVVLRLEAPAAVGSLYAGDDVRWLEALWEESARLEKAGRRDWALAEGPGAPPTAAIDPDP